MSKYAFKAVIFDLDGVITQTALVHSTAWKQMFDEFLKEYSAKNGIEFQEFSHEKDYLPYVDGKPRYKGVASFLASRDIEIPFGEPADSPDNETVCGLGNRKDRAFNLILERDGVQVYESTVRLITDLKKNKIHVGVASSSKNCENVLRAANLLHLFETRVDGVVSAKLNLQGKPEPDIFTRAADNMQVSYNEAVVVEDAVSGVQAGAKGNFGLVLGIARENNRQSLLLNGADVVVSDLSEFPLASIQKWFKKGKFNDAWNINYRAYEPEKERTRETLTTIGNGYFAARGAMPENTANKINYPGTYIAGVYNRLTTKIGGQDIENEDFVNCPNWQNITFKIDDGNWFDINKSKILDFKRELNFRTGVLKRRLFVELDGKRLLLENQQFASMANPHLAAMRYEITCLNFSGKITLHSEIDGNIINAGVNRYKELNSKHLEPNKTNSNGGLISLSVKSTQSKIEIVEAAQHLIFLNKEKIAPSISNSSKNAAIYAEFDCKVREKSTLRIEKLLSIFTSQDADIQQDNLLEQAEKAALKIENYKKLLKRSAKAWNGIWNKIDVQISGDRFAQKLLRLHLYHLMVSGSQHNTKIDAGITARGLHGEAYRGHIFWDELFILPFYNIHFQEVTRSLLMYRYKRLDAARAYAKAHNEQGAMFPWQSGSDGREETQVLHLNPMTGEWGDDYSSLQRHVSLAIAYNVWQYFHASEDLDFMKCCGAELFFEICRFWAGKSIWNESTERFEIQGVMGPDEFHEKYPNSQKGGLKDNTYTNLMVVWSMRKALRLLEILPEKAKKKVLDKISLPASEIEKWKKISQKMNLIISEAGIFSQYDGYFDLKELDWDAYREKYGDIHRLDRILKAEGKSADDYKIAKQADTLMAFYNIDNQEINDILQDLDYHLPADYLQKNMHYYLKRTSHGSTLSRVVHARLAKIIPNQEALSWQLYMEALASDYVDIQGGTTGEGVHTGVMAATISIALTAYAGISWQSEILQISPQLPAQWEGMKFNLTFKGVNFSFKISKKQIRVKPNQKVHLQVGKLTHRLKKDKWNRFRY